MKNQHFLSIFILLAIFGNVQFAEARVRYNPSNSIAPLYLSIMDDLPEKLLLPLEGLNAERFRLVHKSKNETTYLYKWVPIKQSLDNCKEKIVMTYNECMEVSSDNLISWIETDVRDLYPEISSKPKILYNTNSDFVVLVETEDSFYALFRYTFSPKGVHTVLYERQLDTLTKKSQKFWAKKFKTVPLVSMTSKHRV